MYFFIFTHTYTIFNIAGLRLLFDFLVFVTGGINDYIFILF